MPFTRNFKRVVKKKKRETVKASSLQLELKGQEFKGQT